MNIFTRIYYALVNKPPTPVEKRIDDHVTEKLGPLVK